MPFTAAERIRQYQKRLKENKEVYEKIQEKDRQRKATKRSQMIKSQLKKHRVKQSSCK